VKATILIGQLVFGDGEQFAEHMVIPPSAGHGDDLPVGWA